MYISTEDLFQLLFCINDSGDFVLSWHRGTKISCAAYTPGAMSDNLHISSEEEIGKEYHSFFFTVKSFQQLKSIIDAI